MKFYIAEKQKRYTEMVERLEAMIKDSPDEVKKIVEADLRWYQRQLNEIKFYEERDKKYA